MITAGSAAKICIVTRSEVLALKTPRKESGMTNRKNKPHKRPAFGVFGFLLAVTLAYSACGYRVRSSVGTLPSEAHSIGIPTFKNLTTQYKIEQLISGAVLKEFSMRTRATVNSSGSGVDLVLLGEIKSVSSAPVTFNTQTDQLQTYGSTFLVKVQLGVKLVRLRDSSILWQNEDLLYMERYVLNSNVQDFFSEENPALERLAHSFAATLVSSILNRSKP